MPGPFYRIKNVVLQRQKDDVISKIVFQNIRKYIGHGLI